MRGLCLFRALLDSTLKRRTTSGTIEAVKAMKDIRASPNRHHLSDDAKSIVSCWTDAELNKVLTNTSAFAAEAQWNLELLLFYIANFAPHFKLSLFKEVEGNFFLMKLPHYPFFLSHLKGNNYMPAFIAQKGNSFRAMSALDGGIDVSDVITYLFI